MAPLLSHTHVCILRTLVVEAPVAVGLYELLRWSQLDVHTWPILLCALVAAVSLRAGVCVLVAGPHIAHSGVQAATSRCLCPVIFHVSRAIPMPQRVWNGLIC